MMAEERRRGMDDLAKDIGGLLAGFDALNRRLDALQLERQQQHVEAIRSLTGNEQQAHEIKHTLAEDSMKIAIIGEKVISHQDSDRKDHEAVIARLDAHQRFASEGLAEIQREILSNRQASEARDVLRDAKFAGEMKSLADQIHDLSAWRHWVYGAGAAIAAGVALAMTVFGHEISEGVRHLFSSGR